MPTTRCDLHLHSSASVGSDEWYTRVFGCPESYAEPLRQYELCKARGMSLVTLTDHDTIVGGLTLMDRPDFFLSEEITAVFPENGCVMHVLAWNITPAEHDEIQSRRKNIYDLCEYLNRVEISHGLAHPLLSPNWRLDRDVFEKVLLLFPTFEGINGLTDRRIDSDLTTLLDRLTPEVITALAAKHDLAPRGLAPHKKSLTAGSDDHGLRRCGTVYTEVDGSHSTPAFLEACLAGAGRLVGQQASLRTMATCVKETTYHHLKDRQADLSDFRNPFLEMMDLLAGRETPDQPSMGGADGFLASLLAGQDPAICDLGQSFDILDVPIHPSDEDEARLMDGIASVSNKVIERGLQNLLFGAQAFDFYRTFSGLRELAGGLVAAAPVFFAADHFGRQDRQVRRLREQWNAFPLPAAKERLALFSDSLEQVDGVSTWCRRFADHARAAGREVLVPHCSTSLSSELKNDVGWHHLPALTSFSLPLYDCIRLYVPSLIHTLDWAWRERVTHVELSTPGPMGLAGLLVAKILRLPVTASYHTEVPALIGPLGGTGFMEAAARKYLSWFYARVDHVFAVSSQSRETLLRMGVKPEKLSIMPVAVDPNDFSPAHRSPVVFQDLDLDIGDRPVVLSVGRLSEEKNVPLLVEAVERLQARFPAPLLLVVGDGPERSRLEERCREKEFVRLVGPQHGDTLRRLYASARVFVFASRVDTLGLVNMEAMASGVPVLVPSDACIAEFVTHGISAECYEFGAAGLATAIENVLDDRPRAERLAAEGRRVMVDRWKQASFSRIWKSFTQQP